MRHPNAGGVLILGLGCENNQLDELMRLAGPVDRDRIAFFNTQDVIDELEEGTGAVARLIERIAEDRRTECPVSDLVLGHKCGGSDGFSGISANPLLGRIADRLTSLGNDGGSSTAMTVSGATLLLFTTGRGTPLGFPVPTIKVSSNSEIAAKKPHWIDFNAGALLDGTKTMAQLEDDLFAMILAVASGEQLANNEKNGYREIAMWKEGVTL